MRIGEFDIKHWIFFCCSFVIVKWGVFMIHEYTHLSWCVLSCSVCSVNIIWYFRLWIWNFISMDDDATHTTTRMWVCRTHSSVYCAQVQLHITYQWMSCINIHFFFKLINHLTSLWEQKKSFSIVMPHGLFGRRTFMNARNAKTKSFSADFRCCFHSLDPRPCPRMCAQFACVSVRWFQIIG